MPNADAIRWFKDQFHRPIEAAVQDTPFDLDLLTAIACQETGYIWNALRKQLPAQEVLKLCVGDTLDADKGRRAFPQTMEDLKAKPNGQAMFAIARQALVDLAQYVPSYQNVAAKPHKFCHGFGIFQYDLQFFLVDPQYFLQQRYADFEASLAKALEVLQAKLRKLGWQNKTTLTDDEMAAVAIAYNTGGFKPSKGLKQGYFNGSKYYGEAVFDFIRLSRTVPVSSDAAAPLPARRPGSALVPSPTPVTAAGSVFEVDVTEDMLRVRRTPVIPAVKATANVIGRLPDGHIVRAVTGKTENGFLEIQTSFNGAFLQGFAFAKYLKPASVAADVVVEAPSPAPPTTGITAVYLPHRPGTVTQRTAPASAGSLNESGQPERKGTTADELLAEIAALVDWLAVDNPAHKRYQPRSGLTFCNIYAHDYCHLAGCYLPRVWWTPAALVALAQGQQVKPLYGKTVDEQRANDLFRWLRDFGMQFGWRQTGTLSKLQLEVNHGAIGILAARRKEDGRSGHIVAVVPETEEHRARRNAAGEVIAPLQSQAGVSNFRYGTGKVGWWLDSRFAEFAYWLHS